MKRIFALLAALVLTIGAFGQSPKAIIAKMESVLEKHEKEGITMTMRGISFGVSEKQVTFNKSDYPTATIEDKR